MENMSRVANISFEGFQKIWADSTVELSGSLTSNAYLPVDIRRKFISNKYFNVKKYASLIDEKHITPQPLNSPLNEIKGLDTLFSLQALSKPGCVTVFRAIRFPNPERIINVISKTGITEVNYEQERLERLYTSKRYHQYRNKIMRNKSFSFQPQERIVSGLPVFFFINDAIQIHNSYRGDLDRILIVVAFIPKNIIDDNTIDIYSNNAFASNYNDDSHDYNIVEYIDIDGVYKPDFDYYRFKGIELYEAFISKFPSTLDKALSLGIKQKIFMLDLYRCKRKDDELCEINVELTKSDLKRLYEVAPGFVGSSNLLARMQGLYLPFKCHEVIAK